MNTSNIDQKNTPTNTQFIKLMVFNIAQLTLAFNINVIKKIINYDTIYSSGLNYFGMVNIGDQEITVIDLHKRLFNTPLSLNENDKKYLILLFNSVDELFGIMIKETPLLLDIPLKDLRTLPESYRNSDTLAIASHLTLYKKELFTSETNKETKKETMIFILDPDELISPRKKGKRQKAKEKTNTRV